jgi:hypothetical protein
MPLNDREHGISHSGPPFPQPNPRSRLHSPGRSTVTEASLQREIEDLDYQQHLFEICQQRRPDSRYTKPSGHSTAFSVVGTGLAVVQLVAAMACTIT